MLMLREIQRRVAAKNYNLNDKNQSCIINYFSLSHFVFYKTMELIAHTHNLLLHNAERQLNIICTAVIQHLKIAIKINHKRNMRECTALSCGRFFFFHLPLTDCNTCFSSSSSSSSYGLAYYYYFSNSLFRSQHFMRHK